MTPLDAALQWHDLGIATIPIRYRSKRPVFAWKKYQSQLPEESQIRKWFKSRFTNIAVITGFRDLIVIDFDDPAIWQLWQSWINFKIPDLLRQTYRVATARGQHVYLFLENPPERTIKITDSENRTLIDVKAAGGYCLMPPSIHPTGRKYEANGYKPSNIITVSCLEDVLPGMLVENALCNDVVIPEYNGHSRNDVWSVTPDTGGNSIAWIKENRTIAEFFPNRIASGGGRWFKVLCPFHDDTEPSGWIDIKRNRFGCQACMNNSVDIIDFYCLLQNVSRKQAIRELAG